MHSKRFGRGFLVLSVILSVALPKGARGADEKPKGPTGKAEMTKESAAIKGGVEDLEKVLAVIRTSKEYTDEEKREADMAVVQAQIDKAKRMARKYDRKVSASDKKLKKVVSAEAELDEQDAIIADANAKLKDVSALSIDEIAELRQKVADAEARKVTLQGKVDRKSRKYKNKVGVDIPVRCESPQGRNAENKCETCKVTEERKESAEFKGVFDCVAKTCETGKELSEATGKCLVICESTHARDPKNEEKCIAKEGNVATKRKLEACWDESKLKEPAPVVYSLFEMSKSDIDLRKSDVDPEPAGNDNSIAVTKFFESQVKDFAKELGEYGRVLKIEATSYTSKVNSSKNSKRTPEELASQRGMESIGNLFGELSVSYQKDEIHNTSPRPRSLAYTETHADTKKYPVSIGPAWSKGEVDLLGKKRNPSKEVIAKYAAAIFKSKDPTPVKGKTLEETIANLTACCRSSEATLKYQPYQFTKLVLQLPTFTPDTQACRDASVDPTKVSNAANQKDVPPGPETQGEQKASPKFHVPGSPDSEDAY